MLDSELLKKAEELRTATQRNRHRLIDSELALASTFCSVAETEARLGQDSAARELLRKVRQALDGARTRMFETDQTLGDEQRKNVLAQVQKIEDQAREIENSLS